jgi:hypothetical protein
MSAAHTDVTRSGPPESAAAGSARRVIASYPAHAEAEAAVVRLPQGGSRGHM